MNQVSIFEKKWLDLVFEGKNKSYGAYQLRREHPKTTLFALLIGLSLLASFVGIGILASRLSSQTQTFIDVIKDQPTIVPVDLTPPEPKPQNKTAPVAPIDEPDPKPVLRNPTVVKHQQATHDEFAEKPTSPDVPAGTGISGINPTEGISATTPTAGTGTSEASDDKPKLAGMLDKQPQYPGGMENFYKYVGNNFDKPDLDDAQTITVYVSFIIEKDGSMTDIRVLRDPGYGMAREAIRVLKSNKAKWEPGIKDGKPVRAAYTLPITVNIK